MYDLTQDTVGGVNKVIDEQKANTNGDTVYVNLVTFNYETKTVYDREELANVKKFSTEQYSPDGGTALYDAVCSTIKKISDIHKYVRKEDVPEKTLFVIITDGMENSSTKFSGKDVKNMIDEKKKSGWEFLFLGANIDSESVASDLGVDPSRAVNWISDTESANYAYDGIGQALGSVRARKRYDRCLFACVDKDYAKRGSKKTNKK
jgi:hypothetical protein